jgi:hypothetical protein
MQLSQQNCQGADDPEATVPKKQNILKIKYEITCKGTLIP